MLPGINPGSDGISIAHTSTFEIRSSPQDDHFIVSTVKLVHEQFRTMRSAALPSGTCRRRPGRSLAPPHGGQDEFRVGLQAARRDRRLAPS